jgi:hypothetical protein
MAEMKHRTLEIAFSMMGSGEDGYEKPNKAQTANTRNIPAREKMVLLFIFIRGDNVNSDMVDNSMIKSGKKKRPLKRIGLGGMAGYVLFITIKSNGSSKIIGAAIAATAPLRIAITLPFFQVVTKIRIKVIRTER